MADDAKIPEGESNNTQKPAEPAEVELHATVPPKPPVTNLMPRPPEIKLERAPMTSANARNAAAPSPVPPAPAASAPVAPTGAGTSPMSEVTAPTPLTSKSASPPVAQESAKQSLADEVGLVRPKPQIPLRDDIGKILESIKLPEKREFTAQADKKPPASVPAKEEPRLNDILAARITEKTPPATPAPRVAESTPEIHVPDQEVFHEQMTIEPVHTLKQDLQDVVRQQKISVVRAVALEQEKKRPEPIDTVAAKSPTRSPLIIFVATLLFLLGSASLGGVYYLATLQSASPPKDATEALVFAEQTLVFPPTQDSPQSIKTQIAEARTLGGTLGSILNIIPVVLHTDEQGEVVQREATVEEFFRAIGASAPENLIRALSGEFFFGIHTVDKNAPVLVIKVSSYDRAFDGMLTWEKSLNGDLAPIFTAVPRLVMGEGGISIERPFTDIVMRNYDVRALKDDAGTIQLYYSFPTRDLLVIAESPYTFTEILSRLQAGRRL